MTKDIKADKFYDRMPEPFDIEAPITNLPLMFATVLAKPNDKKGEPVHVVDLQDYIRLGITVRKLVSKVNFLSNKIHDMAVANIKTDDALSALGLKEQQDETIDSVIAWHRETFPNATASGQLDKWEEEYTEFRDACRCGTTYEQIDELVDLFIVACGIMRFNTETGCYKLAHCCELRRLHRFYMPTFYERLNAKMAKNRARKWEYTGDGNYHHKKGVED